MLTAAAVGTARVTAAARFRAAAAPIAARRRARAAIIGMSVTGAATLAAMAIHWPVAGMVVGVVGAVVVSVNHRWNAHRDDGAIMAHLAATRRGGVPVAIRRTPQGRIIGIAVAVGAADPDPTTVLPPAVADAGWFAVQRFRPSGLG